MKKALAFVSVFFSIPTVFAASSDVELPKIIKEGSASDILTEDPILPVKRKKNQGESASGNIGTQLQDEIPLNFTNYGTPGQAVQFKGFSNSAEHTDVTALGISLNPINGGGFDFSSLPQFLWSDYKFSLVPTASGFNPQTNGATVDLKLWTDQAMQTQDFGVRGTAFGASSGVYQFSAGVKDEGIGAVAGYTTGKVKGPSGSFSGQLKNETMFTPKFHLLASEQDAKTPGGITFPTPLNHTKTTRVIPVLGVDTQISSATILKTSVIYDYSKVEYHDASGTTLSVSDNRNYQIGVENALWSDGWRVGLSARQARFNGNNIFSPAESLGNFRVGKTFDFENFSLDPVFQMAGVSRYGIFPQGSLGARLELDGGFAVFSRLSYLNRFPSFTDRFYKSTFFNGNPDLKKERTKTGVLGFEYGQREFKQVLQGYAQWRADTALNTGSTMENVGDSRVYGALSDTELKLAEMLTVENSLAFASSHVERTNRRYFYLPMWADTLGLRVHPESAPAKLEGSFSARYNGPTDTSGTSELLGGYTYFNAGVGAELFSQADTALKATFKVENLFDNKIQFVRNYPSEGRVFIGSLTGTF